MLYFELVWVFDKAKTLLRWRASFALISFNSNYRELVSLGRFQKIEKAPLPRYMCSVGTFSDENFVLRLRAISRANDHSPANKYRRTLADRADGPNCKFLVTQTREWHPSPPDRPLPGDVQKEILNGFFYKYEGSFSGPDTLVMIFTEGLALLRTLSPDKPNQIKHDCILHWC